MKRNIVLRIVYLVASFFIITPKNLAQDEERFRLNINNDLKEVYSSLGDFNCLSGNTTRLEYINDYVSRFADELSDSDIKLMKFIAGSCLPIVLVTGLYGTKLQIQITNCELFHQNFPKISQACSFDSKCSDGFEQTFWLSEKFQNSKDDSCTGEILRLSHETFKPVVNTNNRNLSAEKKELGFRITFYGNTEKTSQKKECGFGATSNLFDKFSYFSKTTPRGTKDFKEYFENIGYQVGLNLFAVPIDWRLRANDDYNYQIVKKTVNFAYEVTKKPVILAAHSYGGLVSLSYLYKMNSDEKASKIARFITLGTPYLTVPKVVKNFIIGTEEFNSQIELLGVKVLDLYISMQNQKIIAARNPAGFEMFPKDFLKRHAHEGFVKVIFKRTNIENKISKCIKKLYFSTKMIEGGFTDEIVERNCITPLMNFYKEELEKFKSYFPFFPNLEPGCSKRDMMFVTCETEKCPSVWDTYCRLNFYNTYTKDLLTIQDKEKNATVCYKATDTKGFIDLVLKYGIGSQSKEYLNYEYKKTDRNLVDFPNPGVNYTLVYSNFAQTEASYSVPDNPKVWTDQDKLVITQYDQDLRRYSGGDGTVPAMSLLLPGLKWARQHSDFKAKNPVEIVAYCQDESFNEKLSNSKKNPKDGNVFKTIGCRCNDPMAESCQHASIIGDKNVLNLIGEHATNNVNQLDNYNFIRAVDLRKRKKTSSDIYNCENLDYLYNK